MRNCCHFGLSVSEIPNKNLAWSSFFISYLFPQTPFYSNKQNDQKKWNFKELKKKFQPLKPLKLNKLKKL